MSSNNPNRVYLDTETTEVQAETQEGVAGSPGGEPHFPG